MKKLILVLLLITGCSAVWHNPHRPFADRPVKCSKTYAPFFFDVSGASLLGFYSYAMHNGKYEGHYSKIASTERDKQYYSVMLGLFASVYAVSAYMGFADAYNCDESIFK